jgi:putative OPT family oligopeptide transporter
MMTNRNTPQRPESGSIELTVKAIVLGVVLSVIMTAANAYLGLRAGMTVSAAIPAAVVSLGVLSLFRRSSMAEHNLVQTTASAGEAVAAGIIFTVPALVLMGYWNRFDAMEIAKIAAIGSVFGVLFTVTLRRAFILEAKLKFPEGIAVAEVIRVGHEARQKGGIKGSEGVRLIGSGGLFSALMNLCGAGFRMWPDPVSGAVCVKGAIVGAGVNLSPLLVGVGYIVGRNGSILIFLGGAISWFVAIPLYSFLSGDYVSGGTIDDAAAIWNAKIRFLGVGAMIVGGIFSIISLLRPIINGIRASVQSLKKVRAGVLVDRTELDIPVVWVGAGLALCFIPLLLLYLDVLRNFQVALVMSVVLFIFGFFFTAVAGYMAGIVGSSNCPVSGVTISTVLLSSLLLLALIGTGSAAGAASAIIVGAVICTGGAIAGEILQDLKAGQLLGATPWKLQVMELVGAIVGAFVIGYTLTVLHAAYTIGSTALPAPQATLMRAVAEGVFRGNLPWGFVVAGGIIGIALIIIDKIQEARKSSFRVPVLAVAVGIYLPFWLSLPILVGGMIAHFAKKSGAGADDEQRGLIFASGYVTGESIMGILVAVPIFISGKSAWWPTLAVSPWLGIALFAGGIIWLYRVARKKNIQSKGAVEHVNSDSRA